MILKPNWLEPEIVQNVMLKFSLIISLEYNKDTEIEAPVPASVSHHCLVPSWIIVYLLNDIVSCFDLAVGPEVAVFCTWWWIGDCLSLCSSHSQISNFWERQKVCCQCGHLVMLLPRIADRGQICGRHGNHNDIIQPTWSSLSSSCKGADSVIQQYPTAVEYRRVPSG